MTHTQFKKNKSFQNLNKKHIQIMMLNAIKKRSSIYTFFLYIYKICIQDVTKSSKRKHSRNRLRKRKFKNKRKSKSFKTIEIWHEDFSFSLSEKTVLLKKRRLMAFFCATKSFFVLFDAIDFNVLFVIKET